MDWVKPHNKDYISHHYIILSEYNEIDYCYVFSIADENIFAELNVPIVALWPVWWNEHGANERVSRVSLERLINIYIKFLTNLKFTISKWRIIFHLTSLNTINHMFPSGINQ